MAQEFWYPIAGATHDLPAGMDEYGNNGGANKNASTRPGGGRAGPMTHDDATTSIAASGDATLLEQALNIDWPGPMVSLPTPFVFTASDRDNVTAGTVDRSYHFRSASTTAATPYSNVNDSSAAFATHGPADVSAGGVHRPGGGAWVVSDFANEATTFVRVSFTAAAGNNHQVTSIFGEISFVPAAGGFAFLLNLAGLGALPFVGALTDIAHFRSYLSWRRSYHPRHTILTPDETRRAWRELREYRHPRFFLPEMV